MVNSKKLLVLLLAIFAYINVYTPLCESNNKDIKKLSLYKQKLKAEQYFLDNEKEMAFFISESKKNLEQNTYLMHPENVQNSIIFNQTQNKIKNLVKRFDARVVNVLWGEPRSEKGGIYTIMPFTFILEIEPSDTVNFFNELFKSSKVITIEQAFFVKNKNKIIINMQVNLYKNGSLK
ncbi:hypothetical protein JHD50_10605 [Sulfurimonas sp. MAG313]|nr:hypothetical protein [Sulfurimonas sp. MAG313]MDF1881742.1 hypothetical protein [Sulfurimonas sp. MAG313]